MSKEAVQAYSILFVEKKCICLATAWSDGLSLSRRTDEH